MKLNLRSVTFLLAAGLVLAMAWRALPALSDEAAREGTLTVLWGDPGPDSDAPPQTRVTLTGDDGRAEILDIDPASPLAASLPELNGRRVRVAFAPGSRRAMAIEPLAGGRAASGLSGNQRFITILCKFSDAPDEPKPLNYFQGMTADTYPGLDHFWREQSYGAIDLAGSDAAGYFALPRPVAGYLNSGEPDLDALAADCTAAADATVDFSPYASVIMAFNKDIGCCAWGGRRDMTLDGVNKTWGLVWVPLWGIKDISVIAHETGHTFGLPHSSGPYGNTYDSPWDVMSKATDGCLIVKHPVYGCVPQGTIAYHKDMLGWIPAGRVYTHAEGTQSVVLQQLTQPPDDGYLLARIPIDGSLSHFYTVEARRWVGYDQKLPGMGLIIHEVKVNRVVRAQVVDADNNGNPGDNGALWHVGETFYGLDHVMVRVDGQTGTGYTVTISNAFPSAWTGTTIGAAATGRYDDDGNGLIAVKAAGGDLTGASDSFFYAHQAASDSVELTTRLTGWDAAGEGSAQTGLMIRGSLDPGAPYYMVELAGPGNALRLKWRATPGGDTTTVTGPAIAPPLWLKVARTGDNFAAFWSTDGTQWAQPAAPVTLGGFPAEARAGMAVASANPQATAAATFDGPSVTHWTSAPVGTNSGGAAWESGGVFSLYATGGDIANTADGFFYHYLPGRGDLDLRVKLNGWDAAGVDSAKAGLMIRASTAAGAPHFTIHVTGPDRLIRLKVRSAAGAATTNVNGPATSPATVWLRLVRSGTLVSGYYSADGVNWTMLDTPRSVDGLASGYLFGFATTSNADGKYVTAAWGPVKIGPLPVPPTPTPTPTATSTRTPTPTPTKTPTVTPSPTTTAKPTLTPTPTATQSPTQSPTSSPTPTATQSSAATPTTTPPFTPTATLVSRPTRPGTPRPTATSAWYLPIVLDN